MNITHIEVINAKNHSAIENGQMLKVVRSTPCFYFVLGFDGIDYQVSKKTKKIISTETYRISATNQPTVNI